MGKKVYSKKCKIGEALVSKTRKTEVLQLSLSALKFDFFEKFNFFLQNFFKPF